MNPTNALGYLWKQTLEKAKSSVGGRPPFGFCLIPHPRFLASF